MLPRYPISPRPAQNRDTTRADGVLLDMAQAYKSRDRKRLISLLPQAHAATCWSRGPLIGTCPPAWMKPAPRKYKNFSTDMAVATKDRLRAELLLQLGRNRDWVGFNREYALYRMNDDKSVPLLRPAGRSARTVAWTTRHRSKKPG